MKVVVEDHPSRTEVQDAIKPLSNEVHELRKNALNKPMAEKMLLKKVDRTDIHKLAKVLAGTADATELETGTDVLGDPFVAAKLQNPNFKCLSCDKPVALIPSWAKASGDPHRQRGDWCRKRSQPVDSNNNNPPRPKSALVVIKKKEEEVVEADPSHVVTTRSGTFVPQARPKSAAHPVRGPRKHASLMKGGRMGPEVDDALYTNDYKRTYDGSAQPPAHNAGHGDRPGSGRHGRKKTTRSKSPPKKSQSHASLHSNRTDTSFANVVQQAQRANRLGYTR